MIDNCSLFIVKQVSIRLQISRSISQINDFPVTVNRQYSTRWNGDIAINGGGNEAEGCYIERALASGYIHKQTW
jgi:hypothetical protein